MQLKNADLADKAAEQITGPKLSRQWVQQQLKQMEAKCQKVSSTESKDADP